MKKIVLTTVDIAKLSGAEAHGFSDEQMFSAIGLIPAL